MKKLYFLIVAIIGVIVFLQCQKKEIDTNTLNEDELKVEARSTGLGQSCFESNNYPSTCDTGIYAWYINLPEYPGCLFEIKVEYVFCPALGAAALHLGDFEWYLDDPCLDFEADLAAALANGTEDQFMIEFNQSVWRVVTSNILNGWAPSFNGILEIEYNVGACKYMCWMNELDCGDACCRRINTWEKQNGRWVLVEEGSIESFGDPCDTEPYCDPQALQSDECYDNCESLDF
jgi:hypothetical protein